MPYIMVPENRGIVKLSSIDTGINSITMADKIICPSCGRPVVRLVRPVATIGPMPSKPLRVDQIGRTFESNAELREYQRQNGDVEILSSTSNKWQKHKDIVRTKAERKATKNGFRDLEDKRDHFKKGGSFDRS